MDTKLKPKKLNSNGSTLVMAIILISFITILASVILSASITNISMKRAESNAKKTFYSAEAALDEIYSGLGMTAMDSLSEAYESVAETLVEITEIGGISVPIEVDNATANNRLKEYYINNIFHAITGKSVEKTVSITIGNTSEDDRQILEKVKEYLTEFITNKDAADVISISSIDMVKKDMENNDVYSMVLKNMEVSYINEEGYFATVTVDVSLGYPDITASFSKENKILSAFSEYALIAGGNINISATGVLVNNNILAGSNINVYNGAVVTCNGDGAVNVVAAGDINLESDGNGATTLSILGCDIWCTNINLKTSAGTMGSKLTVDNGSNSYIKDDLNINGQGSNATIGGNYYGYSYEGYSTWGNKLQDKSSSIVVNGKKSKLTIEAYNLMVGGHAYINFAQDGVDAYMTGESLSVKGNQEIYMVIDEYIKGAVVNGEEVNGEEVSGEVTHNPMSYDDWMKISDNNTIIPIYLEDFYAYDLLDSEKPYIIKYVDDMYYVYLNFKSKTAASQYFMTIIDDAYFKKLYPRATTPEKEERNALKTIINKNIVNMLGEEENIKISGSGSIISSGAMFELSKKDSIKESLVDTEADYAVDDDFTVNGGTIDTSIKEESGNGTISYDGFALSSIDYGNRFSILTHLCLDVEAEKEGRRYIVNDPMGTFAYKNESYNITAENLSKSAADNVVDYGEIKIRPYNTEKKVTSGYLVMATDDSVVVPNTARYGIILATGDVTVSADFAGIIITQGNINITGSAKISNMPINEIRGYENVKKYLYAYKDSSLGTTESIQDVRYTDIVKIFNWRKNED